MRGRWPGAVIGGVVVVTLILVAGLLRLTTRVDLLALHSPTDTQPVVLVAFPDGVDPANVAAARRDLQAMGSVSDVQTLAVPAGVPTAVADSLGTALWGRRTARPAVLRAALDDGAALADLERTAEERGAALLGLPVLDDAHRALVTREVGKLLSLVALVFFAALTGLWRRPAAALVPIVAVAVGVIWLLGLMGWAAVPLGGPMLALIPLVAVLGLTDAIHVVWRLGAAGASAGPALAVVARACTWTSLTTGAGLLALLATDSPELHRFGIWGAVGTGLVLVTSVALPAALVVTFPALAPRPRELAWRAPRVSPWVAWGVTGVGLVGLVAVARTVELDLVPGHDLPRDHPVLQRHLAQDQSLGGLHPLRVHVIPRGPGGTSDPDAFASLVAVQRAAVNHPAVGSTVSFADAMLMVGKAEGRTVDQIAGRPGRGQGRIRRYERSRERALAAVARLGSEHQLPVALSLDDGARWTLHLRLRHVATSQWAQVLRQLRVAGGRRVRVAAEGYPVQLIRARARLGRDARSVFGIAALVALGSLALLVRGARALVAVPIVVGTGLAVLAGLAATSVALSHANLFALSVAVGLAVDPFVHLTLGSSEAGPPTVVGQGLVVVGLGLLATSEVATLTQSGPVLAMAVLFGSVVTGLLWVSVRSRAGAR